MSKFAEERQKEILELLYHDGRVLVDDLIKRFKVSGVTIRRDLSNLEIGYNSIKRTHGGAIISQKPNHIWHGGQISVKEILKDSDKVNGKIIIEERIDKKERILNNEKSIAERITKFAANLINDFESVIIEGSRFSEHLVTKIPKNLQLKIFTNSAVFSGNIQKDSNWQCFISEGKIDHEDLSVISSKTSDLFKEILTDKAFISIERISNDFYFYTSSFERKDIKKRILKSSKKVIGMYEFLGSIQSGFNYRVDNLESIDTLIIGGNIDKKSLSEIKKNAKIAEIYTV